MNPFSYNASGAVKIVEAPAGLPAGTVYHSGLPFSGGAIVVAPGALGGGGGVGGLAETSGYVTAGQWMTAGPIVLLPAPGANKILSLIMMTYSTPAGSGMGCTYASTYYGSAAGQAAGFNAGFDASTIFSTKRLQYDAGAYVASLQVAIDPVKVVNLPVVLVVNTPTTTGASPPATNILKFVALYSIQDLS